MYLFLKFTHVIMAAVYLGLPIPFGRWFQSAAEQAEATPLQAALRRIRLFARLHLNLAAVFLLVSGLWMASSFPVWPTWFKAGLVLLGLTLVNLNLNLLPALLAFSQKAETVHPGPAACGALRIRIATFSALHHTLTTAAYAAMIFRWPS